MSAHRGQPADLYYFRDHKGLEVDLVLEQGDAATLAEIKSGETASRSFEVNLDRLETLLRRNWGWKEVRRLVVYGGGVERRGTQTTLLPWKAVATHPWLA